MRHDETLGVSIEDGINWVKKAAESGQEDILLQIGDIIIGGKWIEIRHKLLPKAIDCYKKVYLKNPTSKNRNKLVKAYLLRKNGVEAVRLLLIAVGEQDKTAYDQLGQIFESGNYIDVGQNDKAAYFWYLLGKPYSNSSSNDKCGELAKKITKTNKDNVQADVKNYQSCMIPIPDYATLAVINSINQPTYGNGAKDRMTIVIHLAIKVHSLRDATADRIYISFADQPLQTIDITKEMINEVSKETAKIPQLMIAIAYWNGLINDNEVGKAILDAPAKVASDINRLIKKALNKIGDKSQDFCIKRRSGQCLIKIVLENPEYLNLEKK